jgi:hypothetical protein
MIQQEETWHLRADSPAAVEVYCAAETAECNCPDSCERDHGNE